MLLPTQKNLRHDYLNLGQAHMDWLKEHPEHASGKANPFLSPEFFRDFLWEEHARRGIRWSYGGWMEVRKYLWRGSYLEKEQKWLHLGLDVNVPATTPLFAEKPLEILEVVRDKDMHGGWGGRLIVGYDHCPVQILFAHLDPRYLPQKGTRFKKGQQFASVGHSMHNGGWFEHLHIQAMTRQACAHYVNNPKVLDGYGAVMHKLVLSKLYPNPLHYISLV